MHDTIPNTYSKELLDSAFEKYHELKKDKAYKQCYRSFKGLLWLRKNLLTDDAERDPLEKAITLLRESALRKWGLSFLVSPYLKIKQADLHKPTINTSSSLIEFIYAFGISNDVALYLPQDKTNECAYMHMALWRKEDRPRSKAARERDDDYARYVCHLLGKTFKFNRRFIGRLLKITKDTVLVYIQTVESWSQEKIDIIRDEMIAGEKLNRDIMSLPKTKRSSYSEGVAEMQKNTYQENHAEDGEALPDSENSSFD